MVRGLLLAGLVLPLTACGSGADVDEKNASVEDVAAKVREASSDEGLVRPGKWVSTVSIEQMDMPGLPPQEAEQMKRMVAQTHTAESCLTPEEAKQPREKFFSGNEQCRYDHFKMGGGKINAMMRCQQDGTSQVMEMSGSYSPDAYTMRMTSSLSGAAEDGNMSMKMKIEAKRVGECTGKEA